MTIAGSDSGGGAGIQADLRTFAMLGVHGCVAVAAVTVQNSVGVKGFHEIPLDVITGQINAVAEDIGIQAAKTGMLASVGDHRRRSPRPGAGSTTGVPLVVDPVCASMHGDPLLHPSALNALRTELFPIATLVTPNLDEVRLIVDIDVVDADSAARRGAGAARARAAVGAGQGRAPAVVRRTAPTCCSTAPTSTSSTPSASTPATTTARATPWPPRRHARWRTAIRCPTRWQFAKRWVTECLRAAYPLGHGHGPVSALFRLSDERLHEEIPRWILTPSRGSRTGRTASRRGPSR